MARLVRTVAVQAAPEAWVEQFALALHRELSDLRFDGGVLVDPATSRTLSMIRLVAGRHARPGARYRAELATQDAKGQPETEIVEVVVRSWDRSGRSEVALDSWTAEASAQMEVMLESALRPRLLRAAGSVQSNASRRDYASGSWRIDCDFRRWWADPSSDGARHPPVEAHLDHRLGVVTATVRRLVDADEMCRLAVAVRVRGRGWRRPVGFVLMLVGRPILSRAYRRGLEASAKAWNQRATELMSHDPARAASNVVAEAIRELTDEERKST